MRTLIPSSQWRQRIVALAGAFAVTTSMALASTPPAWGQDVDSDDPAAASAAVQEPTAAASPQGFSFGSGDLGLGGSLPIDAANGRLQITVPVPAGTAPAALNAVLTVPAWVDRGWIDVTSGQRPLTRIIVPGDVQTLPVTIALDMAQVSGGALVLDVASTMIPDTGYCPDPRTDPVRFLDAVVDYAGTPAVPQAISEFLPPVLRQLTVFVPAEPTDDVLAAALTLTTSVIEYYGAQNPRVVLRPDTDVQGAPSDGPFERSVVLSENTDPSAELIYPLDPAPPRLFVTGSGSALLDQTRLITSPLADLAVATKALAGSSAPPAVLASDTATLDSMGVGTVTGSPTARIPIDQTRLGRSASTLTVHLTGTYTPGQGSVTAAVGDTIVDVWPAEDTGILDRRIQIPDTYLSRITALDITVEHPGSGTAGCRTQSLSAVTVDGASIIESGPSSAPTPLGFGSLPQALMPQVNLAVSDDTLATAARAVSILGGLQRLSSRPLSPRVTSVDDAIAGSDPAIVVAPDGTLPDTLTLPLASAGSTTLTVTASDHVPDADDGAGTASVPAELTLDAAVPHGSLQVAATSAGAPLLVASSNGAPEQLDSVLGWLDENSSRWFSLTGDILLSTPDRAPVALSSGLIAAAGTPPAADSPGVSAMFVVLLAAAAVVFLGSLLTALVLWRRARRQGRRRRRGADSVVDSGDSSDDYGADHAGPGGGDRAP
ncbi:hypothetical protein CH267_00335 [Rhodococcus sp. 06-621-2]|nr:hypothetical protein [Rhodococcus sp. 06-621-2]OZC62837.1 hypothetical protein CH267_00335 [Rhodococcus sp. 06-621-2]